MFMFVSPGGRPFIARDAAPGTACAQFHILVAPEGRPSKEPTTVVPPGLQNTSTSMKSGAALPAMNGRPSRATKYKYTI